MGRSDEYVRALHGGSACRFLHSVLEGAERRVGRGLSASETSG